MADTPKDFEAHVDTLCNDVMADMQMRMEMFQNSGGNATVVLAALVKTASMCAFSACSLIDRTHSGAESAFDAIRDSLKEDIELTYTVQAGVDADPAESEPAFPSE